MKSIYISENVNAESIYNIQNCSGIGGAKTSRETKMR